MKKRTFILAILIFGLGVSGGLPVKSKQSGQYLTYPGLETALILDSLRSLDSARPRIDLHIDYNSLGDFWWMGSSGVNVVPNSPTKLKTTLYSCYANGWTKHISQYDTLSCSKDYDDILTACYDEPGNDFWSESITMTVSSDLDTLSVISPVDVTGKIYHAFSFDSSMYSFGEPLTEFFVPGTNSSQDFQVSLEHLTNYVVVYINDANEIVNIRRIGG